MRQLVCDVCHKPVAALYTFEIGYEGEPRIGGGTLTWDGRTSITSRSRGRRRLEACRECAAKIVAAVAPVVDADKATGEDKNA